MTMSDTSQMTTMNSSFLLNFIFDLVSKTCLKTDPPEIYFSLPARYPKQALNSYLQLSNLLLWSVDSQSTTFDS